MARRDDRIRSLAGVRLFDGCSAKELAAIAKVSEDVSVAAGTAIVEEGTIGHDMYVVLDGGVSVRRHGRRVALLGAGQYFGELSVLRRAPRTATVVADMDTTLLVISRRGLAAVIAQAPGLATKMLATMAGRLQDADARVL